MSSTFKPYNKRNFVDTPSGRAPREKCVLELEELSVDNGVVLIASNQAYMRMPDGSLRKVKLKQREAPEEMVKLDRTKTIEEVQK